MDNKNKQSNANLPIIITPGQLKPGVISPRNLVIPTNPQYADTFFSDGTSFQTTQVQATGWFPAGGQWKYESTTSFIAEGDQTAYLAPGVQIMWTDNTPVNFAIIKSSIKENNNTTVTIVPSGFTFATIKPITNNFFTLSASPQPSGGHFNYNGTLSFTSSGGAFTNAPTVNECSFSIVGNVIFFHLEYTYNATSGGTLSTLISGLPFDIPVDGFGTGVRNSDRKQVQVLAESGGNVLSVRLYDGTTAINNSDLIGLDVAYFLK